MTERNRGIQSKAFEDMVRLAPVPMIACDQSQGLRFYNQAAIDLFEIRFDLYPDLPMPKILAGIDPECQRATVEALTVVPLDAQKTVLIDYQRRKLEIAGETWTVFYISDAGPRRKKEMLLESEASTDVLSGLLNRRGFQKTLERNLQSRLSLAMIDVDLFKPINDQHGHGVGDEAIRFVSKSLQEIFQTKAICVSRLGGDEFGVILPTPTDRAEIESIIGDFLSHISTQVFSEHDLKLTVSIGLAISQVAMTGSRELLTAADQALYRAKAAGRNQVCSTMIAQ